MEQRGQIEKPPTPVPWRIAGKMPRASSPPGKAISALPKLRGRCTLVTTKLCESKLKSTTGLFDLSFPQGGISYSPEYNSLHDPCLKGYYNNKAMRKKLIQSDFITEDLYVKCSLKEYNEYKRFLENEFLKIHKREEDDAKARHTAKVEPRQKTEAEWQREQWRKSFFEAQERRLQNRQRKMRKLEKEEAAHRQRKEQQRLLRKEQFEIKREAEREHRMLLHLREELTEESKKKKMIRRTSDLEKQRIIHLQEQKQQERIKHAQEMEAKWQRWEEHSARAKEEEEERKLKAERERQKRMEKRERIFKILQKREEEQRKKIAEQNHQQAEQLKEQADLIEQTLKHKKEKEMQHWKSDFEKRSSAWEEKICTLRRHSKTSFTSVHTGASMSQSSMAGKAARQVRFNSKLEVIPLTTLNARNGTGGDRTELEEAMIEEEDIILEDDVDCAEDERTEVEKEQDKEEFAMKKKSEEMACTMPPKAVREVL